MSAPTSKLTSGVSLFEGRPPQLPERAIEVDLGRAIPNAFGGLRRVIGALEQVAPEAVRGAAEKTRPEWNRLLPGTFTDAPPLEDVAVTPSERRLHRESEQMFRVLNAGARAILAALEQTGRPLVLRNAGATDLLTLRGLMRAAEWGRLRPAAPGIWLSEWSAQPGKTSVRYARRRKLSLEKLAQRLRAVPAADALANGGTGANVVAVDAGPAEDSEHRYLRLALDPSGSATARMAAALHGVRACFFSTNYDGALLSAEVGLSLLDSGAKIDRTELERTFAQLDDPAFAIGTLELDATSLGDEEELRSLLLRNIAHVSVFNGDFDEAFSLYEAALGCRTAPERQAMSRMFRALTMVKRLNQLDKAQAELNAGLQILEGRSGADAALQEGWLRNLLALTLFMQKDMDGAMAEEHRAMACMQGLKDHSAAHLITNLVSNISVLHEAAKQYDVALATWAVYEQVSIQWGTAFFKHHRFRRAGLHRLTGNVDAALADCEEAYRLSGELGDHFHRQAIGAEVGRWMLDLGRPEEARRWFARAVEHARIEGEPQRLGEALAGLAISGGDATLAEAKQALAATSTYPNEAQKLANALDSGDPAAIRTTLPAPRTKLNRPFDPVNL